MENLFLVIRTTFFALLLMFSLLLLGFAAWNVNAMSASGHHGSGTSIFMIFTSCVLFLFIGSATIEYYKPKFRSANVVAECAWVALIALFQLGAAISTTVSGSIFVCRTTGDWNVCASASVLIPVSWMGTLIAFAYFFTLFTTVVAHARAYPDICARTIYTVDWFVDLKAKTLLQQATPQPRLVSWSAYLDGIQSTAGRKAVYGLKENDYGDVEKAPWAENISVRRGKDDPYAVSTTGPCSGRSTPYTSVPASNQTASVSNHSVRPSSETDSSGRSTPATENASLPSVPPRILSKVISPSSFGSKFIERLSRDLWKSSQPVLPQISTGSPFPSTIENHDLPIPLPRKSEWRRADGKF